MRMRAGPVVGFQWMQLERMVVDLRKHGENVLKMRSLKDSSMQ